MVKRQFGGRQKSIAMANTKNTGIEFELLVRSIFQEIINAPEIETISVQHDVLVKGKSGLEHQIDVLWDFRIADVQYKTVIQAKDWSQAVKKEQVMAFKSVLEDIPGQPRGYMVTSRNFQSGGKTFAEFHGIKLFLLREAPKPEPFVMQAGSFAEFYANLKDGTFDVTPYLFSHFIAFQSPGSVDEGVKAQLRKLDKINTWQAKLTHRDSQEIATLGKLISDKTNSFHAEAKLVLEQEPVFRKDSKIDFTEPTFCSVDGLFFQLNSISFTTEIRRGEMVRRPFIRPGITTFILQDVLDGNEKVFHVRKTDVG